MTKQTLWEILVPDYANDGVQYPIEHHHAWDDKVRAISGGLTIFKTAKGQWVSPDGTLFLDRMIPVRIFCDEPRIDQIIELTIAHYDQEAVLAYEVSNNVKLVRRESGE